MMMTITVNSLIHKVGNINRTTDDEEEEEDVDEDDEEEEEVD